MGHSKRFFYQKGVSSPPWPDFESGVNLTRTDKVYSQKIFKIEKHDPYERDEIIRQNKLNRELEERRQNRLLSSQEEAKNKRN